MQIKNGKALELYINSLCGLGKYEQALNYAEELYQKEQFKGLLAKSRINLKLAKANEALELAKQAYALKRNLNSIYVLGIAEVHNKNIDAGLKYANELLAINEKDAKAKSYNLLALINIINKKYDIAKDYLIKANKLDPSTKIKSTLIAIHFSKNVLTYSLLTLVTSGMIMFGPFNVALIALIIIVLFYGYFLNIYLQARNPAYRLFIGLIILQLVLFAVFKLNF